jgi:hypothetical protein
MIETPAEIQRSDANEQNLASARQPWISNEIQGPSQKLLKTSHGYLPDTK